jgi:prolyl-tRNA synthetase
MQRPVWDKFAGSVHTDVMDSVMPCGKVLQTVGAHYLGQKFAKVFNIEFANKAQQPEVRSLSLVSLVFWSAL